MHGKTMQPDLKVIHGLKCADCGDWYPISKLDQVDFRFVMEAKDLSAWACYSCVMDHCAELDEDDY